MSSFGLRCAAVVMSAGLATSAAQAHIASAIFATTGAKNIVPGTSGMNSGERFNQFGTTIGGTGVGFDRPFRSLSGDNWIVSAGTNTGVSTTDEVIITFINGVATVRVREGTTALDGVRTPDSAQLDEELKINDSGDYSFAANLSGTTTDDDVIIKGSGATFTVVAREGASAGPAGTTNGPTVADPNIDNSGRISYRNFVNTTNAELLRQNNTILDAKYGAVVTGFAPRTHDFTFSSGYHVDATGTHWSAVASMSGATTDDSILMYDNAVVLQEGVTTFAGITGSTMSAIGENGMIPNGQWWARGSNAGGNTNDWVVRGQVGTTAFDVLAVTDAPIYTGAAELWDDARVTTTFFLFAGDNNNNYVIGGLTNFADPNLDAVLVYRGVWGEFAILREGDQLDLDGNGILDDDAYVSIFSNDDCFLTDGGLFVFEAQYRNAAGAAVGHGIFSIQIPAPGASALLGLGGLLAMRRRR